MRGCSTSEDKIDKGLKLTAAAVRAAEERERTGEDLFCWRDTLCGRRWDRHLSVYAYKKTLSCRHHFALYKAFVKFRRRPNESQLYCLRGKEIIIAIL